MASRPESHPHARTQTLAAKVFSVEQGTFSTWTKQDDFPKKTAKGYDLVEVGQWLKLNRQPGNVQETIARRNTASAVKLELENAEKKGEICRIQDVETAFASYVGKQRIEFAKGVPRLAAKLSGMDAPAITEALEDWLRATEDRLAGILDKFGK